ncbi:tol-pal system-associated acyl-CoA thioesterase [Aliidiomarina haloalkalitolerans]|uniref:Tol-pal system-associated acyl-CoA thioesterase n=1 Tax=Aliidiomarina haloalkalitolerans TaxID=859059 RepID=A0A432VPS0_9GAMM|nr:tol-pal system-associated acyl-CoA thioesterase [Aliidiomarina haloalkalitolerans]RUO18040.1 tol-pal system-associated acyl-CoA thioesterase [Aliidiomarina haloalkalitolerans]
MGEFSWPVRVYYEDTDAGGIVYYANYLKFCERARTEWLRAFGVEQDIWLQQNIGFVVRHVALDLRAPARFNDELTVTVVPQRIRKASIECTQEVLNQDGKVLCVATVTAACVNLATMKPVAIPGAIIEVLGRGS